MKMTVEERDGDLRETEEMGKDKETLRGGANLFPSCYLYTSYLFRSSLSIPPRKINAVNADHCLMKEILTNLDRAIPTLGHESHLLIYTRLT